ncbi:MAG TPA: hypothetical protein VMZ32_14950 [Gammaproteobacteria bacterium]|nr:hypothetical protein [Gammaproteobacteria bacterium]
MKRPNKEELGKILDPNKISNFVSPDGQLNEDENYESSCIEFYLGLDNWEVKEGLLLLCGIEPQGAVINYGYENSFGAWIDQVVIHHARFIGRTDIYEIPSSDDVMGWLHECNEEYQANHQDLIDPSGKNYQIQSCYSATKEQDALYAEYGIYENLLDNKFFNQVWEIRSRYAKRLSRYRLMWKSGSHEDRNPPDYYIDWVLNLGHKIPWLEWVKSEGLLPGDHSNPRSKGGKTETEGVESSGETTKALPPRLLTGIAKMFSINKDVTQNLVEWKNLSRTASRNGLKDARVSKGVGRRKSIYDPLLIADWLVEKGYYSRDNVNRRLSANLEPGYEHLKDDFI